MACLILLGCNGGTADESSIKDESDEGVVSGLTSEMIDSADSSGTDDTSTSTGIDPDTSDCPSPPEYLDGLRIDSDRVLRLGSRVTASVGGWNTTLVCGDSFIKVIKIVSGEEPEDCCLEQVSITGKCIAIARNRSFAVAATDFGHLLLFQVLGNSQLSLIDDVEVLEAENGHIYEIALHDDQVYVAAGKAGLLRFAIVSGQLVSFSKLPGDYLDVRGVSPIGDAVLVADAAQGMKLADAGLGTVHQAYHDANLAPTTRSIVSEKRAAVFRGPGPVTILEMGPDNFTVEPITLETAGTSIIGGIWEDDQLLLVESARIWRVDFRSGKPEVLAIEERPRFGQKSGQWLTGLASASPGQYSVISGSEIFPLIVGDDTPTPNLSVISMTRRFSATESATEVTIPFRNVGTIPLVLTGIQVEAPLTLGSIWPELVPSTNCNGRFSVVQGATFRVSVKSEQTIESDVVSRIRLYSNDPSRSEVGVRMIANPLAITVGQDAPKFVLPSLVGSIEELPGQVGKVVLLVFVNYSQSEDRSDLQYAESQLLPNYGDKGLVVWAINSGREHSEVVAKWAQQDGLNMPILFDAESEVLSSYWVDESSFPRSVLIDQEGKVAAIDLQAGFSATEPVISSLLDPGVSIE